MEIFDVKYGEQTVTARIGKDGSVYISLPRRNAGNDSEYIESIEKEERGWRFSSFNSADIEYYFHMWYRYDGTMAWANDLSHKIHESREPFNPNYPNEGVLNDVALRLYDVVQQVEAHKAKEIPAEEIMEIRKHNLVAALHLLGYDSIDSVAGEVNDSVGYLALNRLAGQLQTEGYPNLAKYIHSEGRIGSEDMVRATLPEGMTVEELMKLQSVIKGHRDSNFEFIRYQDEWLDKKRGISFDHNALMSKKVVRPGSVGANIDWEDYSKAVKMTAMLFLELNSDLLTEEQRKKFGIQDVSKLSQIDFEDRISRVIDSAVFNRACRIENEFAFEESSKILRKAEAKLEGVTPEIAKTNPVQTIIEIARQEREEVDRRRKAIEGEKSLYADITSKKAVTDRDLDDDDQYGY